MDMSQEQIVTGEFLKSLSRAYQEDDREVKS